jgi:hypothetical protein
MSMMSRESRRLGLLVGVGLAAVLAGAVLGVRLLLEPLVGVYAPFSSSPSSS